MQDGPTFRFPKKFLWGAATSSHQVEGGTENNWTVWEKEHALFLARGSKKAYDTPAVHWYRMQDAAIDPNNYISGRAVDHFHKYEQDFDIAKRLNHNAHRLSIEWSRIEPKRGEYNKAALDHYRRVIRALRKRGIEPMVTLFHFTLPTWVEAQNGFLNAQTVKDFVNYATVVVDALGDEVEYWCTINEPEVFVSFSYFFGFWPPQKKNLPASIYAYTRILPQAHIKVYKMIKKRYPEAKVGASKNYTWFVPARWGLAYLMAKFWRWWVNYNFLDQICRYQDFVGINYYFKNNVRTFKAAMDEQNPSDMGWGLHPEGIYVAITDLSKRFRKPIIITECGLADSQDESRAWYIKEILRNVHRAMTEGADVRGFFYWALLDNFEWDKGYWPNFGLVKVNRTTMKRTLRPSAKVYAQIIKDGGLD
ncbi:glycoside hydrolase family 1 protein [Candidatus Saccharibacteria bacterium]|nr:glycoside hydrolase family 1 protein [Candidatus Saccharibacteria bacterium]